MPYPTRAPAAAPIPQGPWPEVRDIQDTRARSLPPSATAAVLQLLAAVSGLVALVLPGASYEQHTPFGDVHVKMTAGGTTFIGVGVEGNLRGLVDGVIPLAVFGLWFAIVLVLALVGLARRGTGLAGLAVSAVSVGVAALQFWQLVSLVLQMDLEGSGTPEIGMAAVMACLGFATAATAITIIRLRRRLLNS